MIQRLKNYRACLRIGNVPTNVVSVANQLLCANLCGRKRRDACYVVIPTTARPALWDCKNCVSVKSHYDKPFKSIKKAEPAR
jgi:hypothetical protein